MWIKYSLFTHSSIDSGVDAAYYAVENWPEMSNFGVGEGCEHGDWISGWTMKCLGGHDCLAASTFAQLAAVADVRSHRHIRLREYNFPLGYSTTKMLPMEMVKYFNFKNIFII